MRHPETRGIYLKKGIYWLQLPMVRGVRPRAITLQTRDLAEAIERAAKMRALPELAPNGGLRTEIERFLKYQRDRRAYSAATAKAKGYTLAQFADAISRQIAPHLVATAMVQAHYDRILAERSPATAHKALMDIRAFFRWELEVAKVVRANPAVGVRAEPVPETSRVLWCPRELQDRLIAECPREDLKLVLMLGFHAAMRKNEIIQAVPRWFHMERRCIDMQPTPTMPFNRFKRPRGLPMRKVLHDFLTDYGLREPFLLRPEVKQGKDLYRYDFDLPFQGYMRAQGCPWVTAHVMRHTFASLLLQQGESIFKVAQWMGDSVRVVQKHYGHLVPRDEDIELHEPEEVRAPRVSGREIRRGRGGRSPRPGGGHRKGSSDCDSRRA